MTDNAYVFINVAMGKMDDVMEVLKTIEDVKRVDVVYGVYDIVVLIESESMEKLNETVSWHIRRLQHVDATLTSVSTQTWARQP